jgi:hypothetical protein
MKPFMAEITHQIEIEIEIRDERIAETPSCSGNPA